MKITEIVTINLKEYATAGATSAGSIATVVGKWRLDHLIFVVKGVAPDFRCLLVRRSFLLTAYTGVLRRQR